MHRYAIENPGIFRMPNNIYAEFKRKRKKDPLNAMTLYLMYNNIYVNIHSPYGKGDSTKNKTFEDRFLKDKSAISQEETIESIVQKESAIMLIKRNRLITNRERDILIKYFGINGKEYTLEEIGKEYSVTRERVRQIKIRALKKLKKSNHKLLMNYT